MGSDSFNFIGLALPKAQLHLVLPFLFALWMAWSDMKTNRIPNYLTLGCALAGLVYQMGLRGWTGMADGLLGIGLGFALLIFFYWKGGLGAGDVKALSALGAWLGPLQTIFLFISTAISGVLVLVGFLWWRGLLWGKIRQIWGVLLNLVLVRSHPSFARSKASPTPKAKGIPYAMAMALGMALLLLARFYKLTP
jgi:prepilin peptidase CpaA